MTPLSLDGAFWRALAQWGSRGPEWFVRTSPPLLGLVACAIARTPREQVLRNLRRIRGNRGALRDTLDTARTFATYASCLAEILGAGSARGRLPRAVVWGEPHLQDAVRRVEAYYWSPHTRPAGKPWGRCWRAITRFR